MAVVLLDLTDQRRREKRLLDQKKMEAVGKLGQGIAAEFNNVLSSITGYAAGMTEYLLPSSRAYADARHIVDAAGHGAALVKRIHHVTQVTATEPTLTVRALPVADVVRNTVASLQKPFAERKVTFSVVRPETMPWAQTDAAHLFDVLSDLFLNAADAMPTGGTITVDAATQAFARLDPALNPVARPGSYVVLRVRDTGTGMAPDVLDRIFEPFYSTKTGGLHFGLGLAIVRSAIQQLGGWVRVASRPGQGSTFSVYLPAATPGASRALPRPAGHGPLTVLVVDDTARQRDEAVQIIEQAGMKALPAAGGEEAVRIFHKQHRAIDVALVDMIMPRLDGSQVLRQILRLDPSAAVIVTSGFSRDFARSRLPPGNWKFIQKPYDNDQLTAAIRRALDEKTS
jgi:nitrogen-specific signal transduction histidine kinase